MALERKGPEPTPLWGSTRLTLSIVSFLGFVNLYALRVNLSVAMVCMVNHTYVASLSHHPHPHDHLHLLHLLNNNHTAADNYTVATEAAVLQDSTVAGSADSQCDGSENGGAGMENNGSRKEGEFAWSKERQGWVLGSFFGGYLLTQLPGGWLASRYGGKRVLGYCMCLCSLLTVLMPIAARTDYRFLIVLRVLAGVCQGVVWPAMQLLWTFWAPPLEMGKLAGFCYAGSQIGNVITFPLAGLLCEYGFDGGWPSIFYVLGAYGVLWFALWMFLVFDSPACHPRISPEEKNYIESSLKGRASAGTLENKDIPWRKIVTSKAVCAIVVTHMCANWGTYTFLTNIPTYMKEVLKFDIKQNGLLSSLPYVGFWLAINVSGMLFDFLQSRGCLSTTAARKMSNSLGELCPALLVIGVGFVDCQRPVLAVALLTLGVSLCGFQYGAGFIVNSADIAPRYAGIIFGISNTFGTIPGILAPFAIGVITVDQTQGQWRTVFFICAAIYAFGTIFYILFGSGDLQAWAVQEELELELEVEPQEPQPMLKSAPEDGQDKSDRLLPSAPGDPPLLSETKE